MNKQKSSIKDIFLHLLSIITLYASVISLLTILFQIINISIPDPLDNYGSINTAKRSLRFSLSVLIVMFPTYIWTIWFKNKKEKTKEWVKNSTARSLFRNFTIFLAALVLIGALTSLINVFLNGELTTRFSLKIISVFIVIGSVFGFYLQENKHGQ